MRVCSFVFGLFIAGAYAPPIAAQRVIGIVRDSASREAIAGAVVTLRDSAGATLSQTITGGTGRFAAPIIGRVRRLTLVRIGFQPVSIPLALAYPHADTSIALAMSALPTLLAAVDVVDKPGCKRRDGRAAAFALWEQARAALLATIVARKSSPPELTFIHYDQRREGDGRRIVSQVIDHERASSNRPFRAAHPTEEFSKVGYVAMNGDNLLYYAPDADGLLDPAFASGHCFSLDRDSRRPSGEIGLAFEPMHGRDSVVDIAGTIWIDTTARQLRSIDFQYAGLPGTATAAANPGGVVDFRTANGVAVINRWNLHIPEVEQIVARSSYDLGGTRSRVIAIHDIGDVIATAAWPDGTQWNLPLATVRGIVRGERDGKAVGNARVWLGGTDDTVRTAPDGSFQLRRVFPGPYSIFAGDSLIASTGRSENAPRRIEVDSADVDSLVLQIPSIEAFLRQSCDSLGIPNRRGTDRLSVFVLGRVNSSDGTPANNAAFDARLVGNPMYDDIRQTGRANAEGMFQLCYLRSGATLTFATTVEKPHLAQRDTVKLPDEGIVSLRVILDHAQYRAP
ncbi:MAG TPA: carboxypeptidase-like regulatory domain-containing protein [Gemmatimonadaceae bacterium]|nr:carboxypeptidase-like regulatory domain-containing protein [Gemmatimonadaceae bacterium]